MSKVYNATSYDSFFFNGSNIEALIAFIDIGDVDFTFRTHLKEHTSTSCMSIRLHANKILQMFSGSYILKSTDNNCIKIVTEQEYNKYYKPVEEIA